MRSNSAPSISENGGSSLMQEQNQSIDAQIKSDNETEFFQDMENKLQRLRAFIDSLGQDKDKELGKEFLEHFERQSDQFNEMNSNTVIKQTVKRIEKMKKARKIKKNWSSNDMKVLIWVLCKYAQQQSINLAQVQTRQDFWKFVSSVIPGTTPQSCLFKWLSERRYKITLHSWKQQQEKLLMQLQKKYTDAKNKWKVISEQLYLTNKDNDKIFRHPKQCRQHYASFLDPTIVKGPWSKDQDNNLLTYIVLHNGQKKWCKLTKVLDGRTQNAIKNRYQLLFSKLKKKKENKCKNELEVLVQYLKENDPEFQIKKQRAQAVKNVQQEKISVIKEINSTLETIKSVQSMPIIPSTQQVLTQATPKLIIPIVLKHGSNFRRFSNQEDQIKQIKEPLINIWANEPKINIKKPQN